MSDRFEDERGVIQDLFGGDPVNVTYIKTLAGAVRGNHVHRETTQWTLLVRGSLLMASNGRESLMDEGEMLKHSPVIPMRGGPSRIPSASSSRVGLAPARTTKRTRTDSTTPLLS